MVGFGRRTLSALMLSTILVVPAGGLAHAQFTWGPFAPQREEPPPPPPLGEDLSAGKSAAQLFASDCTGSGCHKGPQGLAKARTAGSLAVFLRAHYTSSRQNAAAIAGYLASLPADARAAAPARPEPRAARPTAKPVPTPTAAPSRAQPQQQAAAPSAPSTPPAPVVAPVEAAAPARPRFDIFD